MPRIETSPEEMKGPEAIEIVPFLGAGQPGSGGTGLAVN